MTLGLTLGWSITLGLVGKGTQYGKDKCRKHDFTFRCTTSETFLTFFGNMVFRNIFPKGKETVLGKGKTSDDTTSLRIRWFTYVKYGPKTMFRDRRGDRNTGVGKRWEERIGTPGRSGCVGRR